MRRTCVAGVLGLCLSAEVPHAHALPSQTAPPARTAAPLDLVEVVGCLTRGPNETWVLVRAGQPGASNVPWTTAAAVKEALARPLGLLRFRLIGVSPFKPSAAEGRKVAVKGVLIPDASDPRVNVTSLQTAGETCPA